MIGAVAPCLRKHLSLKGFIRPAGNNIDHSSHRVTAPKSTLCTAHHLDPLDPGSGHVGPVKFVGLGTVIHFNAIHQHQHMVTFGAAHSQLGGGTDWTAPVDGDTGHIAQQVTDHGSAAGFDIPCGNNMNGVAGLLQLNRCQGRGDHDFLKIIFTGFSVNRRFGSLCTGNRNDKECQATGGRKFFH